MHNFHSHYNNNARIFKVAWTMAEMHARCSSASVTKLQQNALLKLLTTPPTIISQTVCALRHNFSFILTTLTVNLTLLYSKKSLKWPCTDQYCISYSSQTLCVHIDQWSCSLNLGLPKFTYSRKRILVAAVQMTNTCSCSQVSLSSALYDLCILCACAIRQIGLSQWPSRLYYYINNKLWTPVILWCSTCWKSNMKALLHLVVLSACLPACEYTVNIFYHLTPVSRQILLIYYVV